MNDVLAEILFNISSDAVGDFVFTLRPGTALSDANGFPIEFEAEPLTIRVVPTPATASVAVLLTCLCCRRRR